MPQVFANILKKSRRWTKKWTKRSPVLIEARTGHPAEAVKILRQLITAPAGGVVSIARLKIDTVWDQSATIPVFKNSFPNLSRKPFTSSFQ